MDLFTFLAAVALAIDEKTGVVICRPIAERLRGQSIALSMMVLEEAYRAVSTLFLEERGGLAPLATQEPDAVAARLLEIVREMDPGRYPSGPKRIHWRNDQPLQSAVEAIFSEFFVALTGGATRQLVHMKFAWGVIMDSPDQIAKIAQFLRNRSDEDQRLLVSALLQEAVLQEKYGEDELICRWGQKMFDPLNIAVVAQVLATRPARERSALFARIREAAMKAEPDIGPEEFAGIVRRVAAN